MTALRFDGVHAAYGPYKALNGLSMEIDDAASVALLGRNGAGKSTVARVASGIVPFESGTVEVLGTVLHKTSAHSLARAGLVHLPEGVGLFTGLTIEENLVLRVGGRTRADRRARLARAVELLPPNLRDRRRTRAAHLSGGQQRLVAVSAAIAARPRLLVVDEPAFGLAPAAAADVYRALREMRTDEVALVVIETRIDRVRELCDRAVVLDRGRVGCDVPMAEEDAIRAVLLGHASTTTAPPG